MKQIMHRIMVVIGIAAAVALASATSMAQMIAVTPGTIKTIAGNGVAGEPSPGSVASGNSIEPVYAIAVAPILNGAGGDIYFSESTNYVKVIYEGGAAAKNIILANAALNDDVTTPVVGDIYLIAGNGNAVDGDASTGAAAGSPGTWLLSSSAVFTAPCGLAVDSYGNLFISNNGNSSGTNFYLNDVVQVVYAGNISSQGTNPAANLINLENTSVSVSSLTTGTTYNGYLFNIAGTYQSDSDNAVPGWEIGRDYPHGVVVDNYENVYIAFDDGSVSYVEMVYSGAGTNALNLLQEEGYTGIIAGYGYALAGGVTDQVNDYGDGSLGYEGAGVGEAGTATSAPYNVWGIGVNPTTGDVYFSDSRPGKVRKLSASTGIISTVVGPNSGTADSGTSSGDGGLGNDGTNASESAALHTPLGIYVDAGGNVYIADSLNNAIRKLDANGYISTIAGTNTATGAYSGDSGNATAANLNTPYDVKLDASGNLWIADEGNSRIREVMVNTSVAGTQGSSVTSSGSFAFGNVTDYSNSAAVAALISNLTGSAITPSNVSIPDDYIQVAGDNAEAPDCSTSTAIPAGTTCTLALEFAPVSAGLNSGSATVAANSDSVTIPMTGTGVDGTNPQLTAISPPSGASGTLVTLAGTNLGGATDVTFGTTPVTPSSSTSTSVTATAPSGSGTVSVTVTTSNGTSNGESFTYTGGTAATPTFSPAAGTYTTSPQTVTISDSTSGATIYYTTSGLKPTTSSPVYSGPITVSASETVKAIAVVSGSTSAVASAKYTIQAVTPTLSPGAGTYNTTQSVIISTTTPSATIYYTTDGTTPTTGSPVYSGPVAVSSTEIVKAVVTASGYINSPVASVKYTFKAATPTFSPAAGTYSSAQTVTIGDATSGATIYYTTDGSAPTTSSAVYSSPIAVSAKETVKAIAVTTGSSNSAVGTAKYSFTVATPIFSLGAGSYSSAQTVTISTTTPMTTIYYTTNGKTPTTNSPVYFGPITVSSSETIQAMARATGYTNSAVGSAAYTITQGTAAVTPMFSPAAGSYSSAQTVTISDATSGATIYYTTDGTTPTTSSAVYSAPISVTASETVEAIATATGYTTSAVGSAAYTVTMGGSAAATPTFSPGAGTYSTPQTVTISDATSGATIYYTTNGTTPTTSSSVYSSPITVTPPETVEAIATATDYTTSAVGSASYAASGGSGGNGGIPVILFTDVQSGPATGGENGNGIYLTIFGYNFGSAQGASTVTINGTAVAQYLTWGSAGIGTVEKIGVQIAAGTTTGPIVVNVGGYPSVNNPTFTVRAGKIWFIGSGTDNSAPGSCAAMEAANSYSTPWGLTNYASTTESNYSYSTMRTPYTYYNCMSPGDTLVFLNGVDYPYFDGRGWHSSLTPDNPNTTSTSFMTIMARPGATATLGGEGWVQAAIRNTGASSYTVYSGLTLIGSGPNGGGLNPDVYDRFVGNTIMCPDCSGPAGAMTGGNNNEALGNIITSISTDTSVLPNGSNKTYHAVYFSGDNFEFGWNRIYNTAAYNGFQINEDSSSGYYNFSIHDNDIADVNGSGINLSTIDPSSGYVQVYNNVIHHTGVALASDGGSDDPHSCIAVKGYGSATGAGTAEIYNNTMYDCSSYLNASGAASGEGESCAIFIPANQLNVTTNLVNNIAYQPSYTYTSVYNVYICGDGTAGTISGSNNIWYSGSTPGSTAYATAVGTIENPLYSNPADGSFSNYLLQSGSPAIGAGVVVGPVVADGISYSTLNWDFNYSPRPNPPSIGAFESGAAVQAPTSTALTASSTSITLGNSLTLTATVTSGGSPTGTVTFLNGSTTLGTGTVNGSGVATYMTSSLAVGSYTLTAQYNGDSSFAPSTSGAFAVIVNPVNLPAAATPTFSPGAGTYSSVQTVTISSTTSGAAIYYTTDGTTPTTSSTLYSSSISVSASETLQAIAVATSYTQSAVGSAAYVINLPAAATPTFSPGAGTYSSAQTVTINSTTSGAAIYYTTDGTTPTISSTLYSGPVTVSTSDPITLRAIAIASGYPQSAASSATYTISYRAGAIHTVQFMSAWEAQAASLAVPFANNVISGDVILVAEGISQKATYAVPTDTQGNTFTQLATADDTNGGEMAAIFVATAQSTAADTVTCNSAVSMHTIHCHIYEVAGVTTTVDQTGSTTQDLVTALSVSTSAPTTNANDYVFAYFAGGDYDDNFTVGPGYGDTQTSNSSTGDSGFSEGAVTTATGVQTATATSNPADNFSDVVVALVGQTQAAATPTFSPAAGSYSSAQTVTISDATSGATIYYTTDGTTPTTSSAVYSAPISVTASETVEAIATATGYTTSAVGSAAYTVTMGGSAAATPTFSPGAGTYSTPQTVTISDATSGATIYYTTNGTTPTTSSSVYSSPITVTPPETVEAIATATDYTTSAVGSASYAASGGSGGNGGIPVILFTDVQSGPATGGENGNGIYLTIFGYNFGSAQGASTVTINGTAVAQYLTWGSAGIGTVEKIGVQIAAGTTTGPIVVNVGGYPSVNNPTFTVRAGKIWFIGSGTDNSAPGSCAAMEAANSYSTPWGLTNYASTTESNYSYSTMRTPYTYYNCMSPGDTLVFLNGVDYPYFDGRGWHSSLTPDNPNTTSTSFMTIMARPGATATLGGEGWVQAAIRNTGASSYTVYSGLTLIGSGPNGGGLNPDVYDRFVGNTIMCPDCSGPAGAMTGGNNNEALGNIITSISTDTSVLPNGSNKTYHAVYFSGDNFEFGWNRIYNTAAYNGFQINEDSSSGYYNFSIHDNDIADVNGSGINLSTIDPSSGYIQVYNNVIHHTGVALASDGGSDDPHSCIAVKGYGSATGAGTVEIYNNTMYDCSSYLNASGAASGEGESCAIFIPANQLNVTTNLVNNIAYQPSYTYTSVYNVYICGDGTAGTISGSNNIWYSGSTPGSTAYATAVGTIENPLYSNPADGSFSNYLLQSGSPAIGAGVVVGPVVADGISYSTLNWDFNYSPRPNPPSIGAFEFPQ